MTVRKPAERFDPRIYVADELTTRGMASVDLPEIVRSWYANPSVGMSAGVAVALSETFGTSARFWLILGNAYAMWLEEH